MTIPGALEPGYIHLLRASLQSPPLPLRDLKAVVTPEERARAGHFLHAADAHRHIIGRGLVRIVLGSLCDTDPAAIRLQATPAGKPFLQGGPSFSIAHSGPVVLLAFAGEGRLGVDVEAIRPLRDLLALARTSFNPDEYAAIAGLPAAARLRPFFRTWTRKEAMLKALGTGLPALASLSVSCEDAAANALVRIDPPEDANAWTVRPLPSDPRTEAAVAWDGPFAGFLPLDL